MAKGYKGNYRGRSDYRGGGKGGVDVPQEKGNRGIPAGITSPGLGKTTKGVETDTKSGNKGIPSGVGGNSAPAPLD